MSAETETAEVETLTVDKRAAPPRRVNLTEGPVGKQLFTMTVPMVWALVAMMGFAALDTLIISYLGPAPLAAVGFAFPVIFVTSAFALGLSVGVASIVARSMGAGREEEVRRMTTDSLLLGVLVSLVLVVVGIWAIDPLFTALGATPEVMPYVREYMVIAMIGIPFWMLPMIGGGAIRATGDTKFPSRIMIISVAINAVLSPILVFGWLGAPRLEIAGAPVASIIARTVMLIATYYAMRRRHLLAPLSFDGERLMKSWRACMAIGLPATGNNAIIPMTVTLITGVIAQYGPEAVAAFGVASRIESVMMVAPMALSGTIGPFVGQNIGAGRKDRVIEAMQVSFRFCILVGLGLVVFLAVVGPSLGRAFGESPRVAEVTALYFWIVPLCYGLWGVNAVGVGMFNALGRPMPAVVLTLVRMLALMLPLALLGSALFGLPGVFGAVMLANVIGGVVAWVWALRTARGHP
jgi:putative MATE family efflux protein